MMDYALCDQTITVYRNDGGNVTRKVYENAWFSQEEGVSHHTGEPERQFLLILPGPEGRVTVGDRVLPGTGPLEVTWESFLPALVPGLVEVGRTRVFRVGEEICHTEAEQAWN